MQCKNIFFLMIFNLISQLSFGMELPNTPNYFSSLKKGTLLPPSNKPFFYYDLNGNVYTFIKVKTCYSMPCTIKIMKEDLDTILENGQKTIKTNGASFEFISNSLTIFLPEDPQAAQEIKNHYLYQTPTQINVDYFSSSSSSSSESSLIELSGALLEEFKAKYAALSRSSSSSSLSLVSEFKHNENTNSSRSFDYETSSETE